MDWLRICGIKDYEIWRKGFMAQKLEEASKTANKNLYVNPMEISNKAPSFKIANYVYRNNGDLSFQKLNSEWGFEDETWSQGAAYADFDNDGDLDLVINNMNMQASLYQNMANESSLNNYVTITLQGPPSNIDGINAMIEVDHGGSTQIYELTPYRGYMSTSQTIAHFGIAQSDIIDQIRVIWHDNKMNVLSKVKVNQNLTIKYEDAQGTKNRKKNSSTLFAHIGNSTINHVENIFDDYKREILLPYKTSTLGPILAKADIDGDGLEDVYLGGSAGESAQLLKINQEDHLKE